jgi:predicted ATP-dependent serine protease
MMLGLAAAAAYGVPFLGMQTPKRIPVLYVDGEMAADELRNRLKAFIAGMCPDAEELGDVHIVSAHLEPNGIPKIDTPQGRAAIMAAVRLNGAKLVILDNLSCLTDPEDESAAGSWSEVQELLLLLRAQGVAVVLGHHSTKKGGQRGTSRRLDVLDVVLRLTPDDGSEETCVRCEYEKARSLKSEAKQPFDAVLRSTRNNGLVWVRQGPAASVNEQVRRAFDR